MPIVAGRYAKIPLVDRLCKLCTENEIGDEFHYLLKCPYFTEDRNMFIHEYYYMEPNTIKMTQLFELTDSKDLLKLAKFIKKIVLKFRSK